jgi:hypothetical protein
VSFKTRNKDIVETLKQNNITDADLRDMIKNLPNGTYNFWDIMDIYGIQYETTMEDP